MAKITGQEELLPEKVLLLYQTIGLYIEEKADFNTLKVADIAKRAEIGKGTVYEYFETKEDLIALAFFFNLKLQVVKIKNELNQVDGFEAKLACIFHMLDSEISNREYMMQFFRMTSEVSTINHKLHMFMEENKGKTNMPIGIIVQIVEEICAQKGITDLAVQEYLVYEICSKLVGYLFWVYDDSKSKYMTREMMQERLIKTILSQIE
ncbi:MAG: helix-turn-helix domain-containing protein [Lachnospiraceae bacterium]